MKLVSYGMANEHRLGLVLPDGIMDLSASCAAGGDGAAAGMLRNMNAFLHGGTPAWRTLRLLAERAAQNPGAVCRVNAPLLAPVPTPPKLICLAGNYPAHVREGGGEAPSKEDSTPRLFLKPPSTTVIGPGAPVVIPRGAGWMDWEGELAIVIGRRARRLSVGNALDAVAGYTIINDISERRLPVGDKRKPRDGDRWFDWLLGKWMDASAPMGPCLVTADEIPDPQTLTLEVRVNGERKQQASTADMTFSCAEIIAWVSRYLTLEPGDVISTGTPAGVGSARGEQLQTGDRIDISIEPIGVLSNPVIDEP